MKIGSKFLAAALLLVALILINYLAAKLPVRLDATADQVYTLSPGTKTLLGKIDEPVELNFYFSRGVDGVPIGYKNFAVRVQEMLRQYVRSSHGKIHLNIIDPKPDTPEEEKATAAGLTPQRLSSGERVFFGLVAIQADQQKTIANFTPQREQFLEYDLSQLLYTVQQVDKKKLGLLTSLPLRAAAPSMPMMMRQSQQESQFVISEWERTFDITSVEPSANELPANLDALAVIHPENLSPKLQYAIDQFILSGKPVFIAVDPTSQHFKRQGGQQAMFGGPTPNVSSDLPVLFKAYGIEYNPQNVVGDLQAASEVQTTDGQVVRYPIWLALTKEDFNAKSLPTAQLNSLLFIEAGDLNVKSQKDLTVTPLVESSPQAGDVPSMMLSMAQPDEVARQVKPTGKKTLAVLIQGKLSSAFPNGAPEDAKPTDKKAPVPTPAPAKAAHLTESKTTSTLIVVADTDWLMDDYSVQMFGRNMASPINDNLAFASNSLEFLSGSQDLISIRGKGSTLRPFVVVKNMEVAANEKYQTQLTTLESRLAEVEKKLSDLQGKKGDASHLLTSPEATKTIEEFRQQQTQMHAQRREIRKALRDKIESLGNELLAINLIVPALLLLVFGYLFYRSRRQAA